MAHRAIRQSEHRDRPLPDRPWAMSMRWTDLLFMHWPIEPGVMREAVPGDFDLDLYDGMAWVGVVPFRMQSTRPRCCPPIPQKLMPVSPSSFPELNVRTYVTVNTEDGPLPGVFFFSLDAASKVSVRLARLGFGLPYFDAQMRVERESDASGWTHFQSVRTHYGAPPARFAASYRPLEDRGPVDAQAGSLERFLTERYRLFTLGRKGRGVRVGEIAHRPWPLQVATCEVTVCEMTSGLGFDLPDRAPLLHYADELDVVAWLPKRI
ncbi:MAG: YqjF family protein [Phycisphaeraceae bacterium]